MPGASASWHDGRVPTCSSCGAAITWARSSSGKAIPLDVEPDQGGNLLAVDQHGTTLPADVARRIVAEGRGRVVVVRRGHRTMDPDVPHWRSHFATCDHPELHLARKVVSKLRLTEQVQDTLPL
jgi:hypothetical protein